jgi:hypothetical protein
MANVSEAAPLVAKALGQSPEDVTPLVENVFSQIDASKVQNERLAAQICEGVIIRDQADLIEAHAISLGFSLPRIFINFTAGFEAPQQAVHVGQYQDKIFNSFVRPDILGHSGNVYLLPLDSGDTAMIFNGRPHNYEWGSHEFGSTMLAHNERVKKELARRQRNRGIESLTISTYLAGVDGNSDIKAGEMAILIDDSDLTNEAHPGHGAHGWFDGMLGERFQPKAGRTSNQKLARIFTSLAQQKGKKIHPGIGVGTAGATEFQSLWEVGISRAGFDEVRAMELTRQVLGNNYSPLGLIYMMGVTAETAVWRETMIGEPDFTGLDLVLFTDTVGEGQSLTINHHQVVRQAIADAWQFRDLIIDLAGSVSNFPQQSFLMKTYNFALADRLPHTDFV